MHAWPHARALGQGTLQATRSHGAPQRLRQALCAQRTRQGSVQGTQGAPHGNVHVLCSHRVSHLFAQGGHGSEHGCRAAQSCAQSRRREHS